MSDTPIASNVVPGAVEPAVDHVPRPIEYDLSPDLKAKSARNAQVRKSEAV